MKTITILGVVSMLMLGLVPTSYASIDKNLKYGQRDLEVTELQEFLIDKGLLKTTPYAFFGLLTLKAVKAYQTSVGVSSTGFVGALTREKINKEIEAEIASSNEAEIKETGFVVAQNINNSTIKDFCKNIDGTQAKVPNGMFMNNDGICFTPTTKIEATTQDVCKNIEGNQTTPPYGMFLDNLGNCFTPTTISYTQPVSEIKKEPLKVTVSTEEMKSHLRIASNKALDLSKTQFIKVKDGCITEINNCSQENRVDQILPITIPNSGSLSPTEFVYRVETSMPFENFADNYNLFMRIKFYSKDGDEFKTYPLWCQVWNIPDSDIPNAIKVMNMSEKDIRAKNGICYGLFSN